MIDLTSRIGPVNQWLKMSVLIRNLRLIIVGLLISHFLLIGVCIYLFNRDSLVIALAESDRLYFIGERKNLNVNESDVEETAKRFVLERYQWKMYNIEALVRNVSPYITYGLLKEVTRQFEKSKKFMEKNSISQDVVIQSVNFNGEHVEVKMDRVVSVGKRVKAVQPLTVHIEVIKGIPNKWNLRGLYVNAITEFNK